MELSNEKINEWFISELKPDETLQNRFRFVFISGFLVSNGWLVPSYDKLMVHVEKKRIRKNFFNGILNVLSESSCSIMQIKSLGYKLEEKTILEISELFYRSAIKIYNIYKFYKKINYTSEEMNSFEFFSRLLKSCKTFESSFIREAVEITRRRIFEENIKDFIKDDKEKVQWLLDLEG